MMISSPHMLHLCDPISENLPDDVHFKVISAEGALSRTAVSLLWKQGIRARDLYAKTLVSELIRFKPDIVFTNYPSWPSWDARLFSFLQFHHVPLLAWLLGDIWTEHDALFRNVGFPSKLLEPFHLFAWSTGLGFADRILTVSSWLRGITADRFPEKNITVFDEGIDPEPWLVAEHPLYDFKRPAVGILQDNNILPKVKGLLQFSKVVRKMQDVNFYIAGSGPYTPLVEKEYSGLRNAHLVGRLSYPKDVRRFYRSTDVYVLASGLDAGPKSVLEASLCERPVVVSKVAGVPEHILDGKTGWAVYNDNIDAWISRIRLLIEDEELRKKMGSSGRRFVLNNFTWKAQGPRLASIFREELR
jgi:glycosyltransferase involved in cell wall biosynthesis